MSSDEAEDPTAAVENGQDDSAAEEQQQPPPTQAKKPQQRRRKRKKNGGQDEMWETVGKLFTECSKSLEAQQQALRLQQQTLSKLAELFTNTNTSDLLTAGGIDFSHDKSMSQYKQDLADGAPKKPPNSYNLFIKERLEVLKSTVSEDELKAVKETFFKTMGDEWKGMSEADKTTYKGRADTLVKSWQEELKSWRANREQSGSSSSSSSSSSAASAAADAAATTTTDADTTTATTASSSSSSPPPVAAAASSSSGDATPAAGAETDEPPKKKKKKNKDGSAATSEAGEKKKKKKKKKKKEGAGDAAIALS